MPVSLVLSPGDLNCLASSLDGVVLSGSPADVDPSRYGAPRHPKCAECDADRESVDFGLLEHCLAEQKPVLAICYGIQSLNVFLSGTLIQDVPSQIGTEVSHSEQEEGEPEPFHGISIEAGSRLSGIARASEKMVNSSHHQAIDTLGRNLRIAARAQDSGVEAVEWSGDENWIVGVQWHPERMAEADLLGQVLFGSLIREAVIWKALRHASGDEASQMEQETRE